MEINRFCFFFNRITDLNGFFNVIFNLYRTHTQHIRNVVRKFQSYQCKIIKLNIPNVLSHSEKPSFVFTAVGEKTHLFLATIRFCKCLQSSGVLLQRILVMDDRMGKGFGDRARLKGSVTHTTACVINMYSCC